jgi:ataxin-10
VLANLLYAAPSVQQDVLELGGVAVLLSQCQVRSAATLRSEGGTGVPGTDGRARGAQADDQSPWVREWALWGVRNMCEGNADVQAAIAELQPRAPVASPELDALNMRVELDQATGKFSLVRGQAGASPVD